MTEHFVLRVVSKLLIPPILLFALYVQMHGDYGPGGGFQAGVIFAAGFILYGLVFGVPTARRVAPLGTLVVLACFGVLLYAGVGVASMIGGGRFLEYGALAHDPTHGNHIGIIIIELGVGIAVAAVMTIIFYVFAERR
jgi:multicomponent Na+:H+ antiporter subunit B